MKIFKQIILVLVISFIAANAFGQGITTAALNGRVTDQNGKALPGASVVAIHEPTGSQFGTISDDEGYFRLTNMNVGGPYSVTISYVGYNSYEQSDIYLTLGQIFRINTSLSETSTELQEVVVTGAKVKDYKVIDGNRTGAETVINAQEISMMPSIAGNLNDFTRFVPQANIVGEGLSLAGMNNRYNSVFIDGTINNDVFGLAENGMNGGQTGISAFSYEAIDQFQVVLAPYDVRESGFVGGGINAVTKSGSNQFRGLAYYKFRNPGLAGKTPGDMADSEREKLPDFTAKTYGFNLGGPIIKNKLFFFLNGEIQHDQTPQPFNFSDYQGNSDQATIDQIADHMRSFGYEPGGFQNNTSELNGKKLLARIDWNISPKHKLMIRNQYTYGESISPLASNSKNIYFYNNGIYLPSTTDAFAIELKSRFNETFSNNLKIGYTYVNDDRDVMGSPFPGITINDGAGTIHAGGEIYSSGNALKQKILTVTDNLQIFKGKNTFTVGTHNEFYNIYNLFMRRAYGDYTFADSQYYLEDSAYNYRIGYSQVDNIRGDGSKAAADFNAMQLGFYVQDEYQAAENLKFTVGVRLDIPVFRDQPRAIDGFNDTTLTKLSEFYDLQGARAGHMPSAQLMISPRVGFNWDVFSNSTTQVRGGIGIFTSRVPFVWPAGSYTNNGIMVGDYRLQGSATSPVAKFVGDVNAQPLPSGPAGVASGSQIDLYADNFKFPQVLRGDLGVDQVLPYGIIGTLEFIYTKTLNNVLWKDVSLKPAWGNATGSGDNRPLYTTYKNGIDPFYGQIMWGGNTNKGYAMTFTAQLRKNFASGLFTSLAYTYGQSRSVFDGTSSQNSSQWNYLVTNPVPRNAAGVGISDFDLGSRIVGMLSYQQEYIRHLKTSLSIFFNGQSGRRISYIYDDYNGAFTNEAYQGPELLYVPKDQNDIHLGYVDQTTRQVIDYDPSSSEFQAMYKDLDEFINGNDYLKARRGKYTERNGARLPWENIWDLHVAQDLFINVADRRQTLQFTLDVFNFGNLLNKDWGRRYYATNNNISIVTWQGMIADPNTGLKTIPVYSFTRPKNDTPWYIDDSGLYSSRWQAQIGLRYFF